MEYRIEKDTMGEVKVPADKYWGAQTERSRNNFKIGPAASMPREVVYGFAYLKKAAAYANHELGVLPVEKRDYRYAEGIWSGNADWVDGAPLEVVPGAPEGAPIPDFQASTSQFSPDYTPEEIYDIAQKLMQNVR